MKQANSKMFYLFSKSSSRLDRFVILFNCMGG